jgi:alkanesulfonate monooxygenase SsuD/methylene tetrahydromethanopterin reductase-like flavin-dependent oxidoreductase (luciferase family)
VNRLRSALWPPLFDGLADPLAGVRIAADAEEAGWDGCFVRDQLCRREPVRQVADPWIAPAASATVIERIRPGPMVTALPRRRPAEVARESATLDRLSEGRLTLAVCLGGDRFAGELSRTGEELDARRRGRMLDQSLGVLAAVWSGEPVRHRGEHCTFDDIAFVQRPGVPAWAAGMPVNAKPIRRSGARRPARRGRRLAHRTAPGPDGLVRHRHGVAPECRPRTDTARRVLRDGPAA